MDINNLAKIFRARPYTKTQGKGLLARRYNVTPEMVAEAKRLAFSSNSPLLSDYNLPRILIFDVETAPMRAYVWGRWKQNISLQATISEWFMIAWSAKWLYSNEVLGDVLTTEEAINEDDSRIVKKLWNLVNEADIIIAYNGRKADVPWMNTRFILNGLEPPKPYFLIDPCEVAKRQFGFSSNKLDALAGYFDIPHKLDTDFELWKRCLDGDEEALSYMLEYNKKDTVILEEVYIKMRPWIKGHPNIGNYVSSDVAVCSACGSDRLELLHGQYYYTNVGKYQLFRCRDCGCITRGRKNLNVRLNKVISVNR